MSSISLDKINENNTDEFRETCQFTINKWIEQFKLGTLNMPKWQRQHQWDRKDKWEESLIMSILLNHDIPKLYVAEILEQDKNWYIIDGGHRTRSINNYIDNKFPINIDGVEYYYSKIMKSRTKVLKSDEPKLFKLFNDYKLTIIKYLNTTEKDARRLFNILQNTQPMSVADVINSHESSLIDELRKLMEEKITINGTTKILREFYEKDVKPLKKYDSKKKATFLEDLVSKFTICNPIKCSCDSDDKKIQSLSFLLKGKTKKSPHLEFVRNYDEEITIDNMIDFKEFIINMITILHDLNINKIIITDAELNSLIHANHCLNTFDIELFKKFVGYCKKFNKLTTGAEIASKNRKYDIAKKKGIDADKLDLKYGNHISIWLNTKRIGGSNNKGMKIRYDIIKKYCTKNSVEPEPELITNTLEGGTHIPLGSL